MNRSWLREVPPTLANQQAHIRKARAFKQWWGESAVIRCPGCGLKQGLRFLEFRNDFGPEDTYRIPGILAVCPEQAERLIELRDTGAVFGISALVKQVPWICATPTTPKQRRTPSQTAGTYAR